MCVSFVAYHLEYRDLVRQKIPVVTFIRINVEKPLLIDRNFERMKVMTAGSGKTMAEQWADNNPVAAGLRAQYGEEYSEAAYKQYLAD